MVTTQYLTPAVLKVKRFEKRDMFYGINTSCNEH